MNTSNMNIWVVFTLACFVVCAHLTFAATLPSSSSSSSNDLEHLDTQTEISFQNQAQPLKRVKRKFSHGALGCRGVFHKAIFHKLDRLCDDCYEIYKIPEIHQLCRSDCFSSQYFKSCVNALMLKEKDEIYQEMVSILG